jgi:putative restriction endonuclease
VSDSLDHQIRVAAFAHVSAMTAAFGDVLPHSEIKKGFQFDGSKVGLMGTQRGIFKPAIMSQGALSITTTPENPRHPNRYVDRLRDDGFLEYSYQGENPEAFDNVLVRTSMIDRLPMIYFLGVSPGQYLAFWPVYAVGDDPKLLMFTIQVDSEYTLVGTAPTGVAETGVEARRAYVTRAAVYRLHQSKFRERVLRAYRGACAVCSLRRRPLLDAAHIISDRDPRGTPMVSNGLSLCKIHHAAFDRSLMGIRGDLVVVIRKDVLDEEDGPMLLHGLKECHGHKLREVPRKQSERPNPDFLEERFATFKNA